MLPDWWVHNLEGFCFLFLFFLLFFYNNEKDKGLINKLADRNLLNKAEKLFWLFIKKSVEKGASTCVRIYCLQTEYLRRWHIITLEIGVFF